MTSGRRATAPFRRTKPLEWWATRNLLRFLRFTGRWVTPAMVRWMGAAFGSLAYRTMTRYRRVALANLHRAYGDRWSPEARERIARSSFQHLGVTAVEFFLRQPRLTQADVLREVRFEGQEHYEAAFARGRGVILVTAHYGNWEVMGPRLAAAGYVVNAVSRTADDAVTEELIASTRRGAGVRQIPRRRAAREGLAALRRNEILAILLDQNTMEGGIFVPFFGHPASTATGPAVFALKTGAAILPTFSIREADGSHLMKTWPPILPESSGDRDSDVRRLTAAVTLVIEEQVRERPELWCWLHNRWKRQPEPAEAGVPSVVES